MTIREMINELEKLASEIGGCTEVKVLDSYWANEGYGEDADNYWEENFTFKVEDNEVHITF